MKKLFFTLFFTLNLLSSNQIALIKTTQGDITIQLIDDIAPKTVENFVQHSKNGYYNGLIFHRIIKNFMIQGGDPTGTGRGGTSIWKSKFQDEFSSKAIFNKPGILAMANSGPNTNGSQFFITTVKTPWLNNKHTIFGYVIKGMDVLKRLENVATNRYNKPLIDQKIKKIIIK
jgi:peptidylprolyl isomerase